MTAISNSTAAFFHRSLEGMGDLRARGETLQQQISTGERLERSSDNPLVASRLRNLSRAEALSEADSAVLARAATDMQLSGAAMEDMADTLIRARELVQFAANGALGDEQRTLIAEEIVQLRTGLLASANTVGLAGQALFAGEGQGAAYLEDAAGGIAYAGTPTSGAVSLSDGTVLRTGLTGPEVLTGASGDPFTLLADLALALRGGAGDPETAARDALGGLDDTLETLNRAQTTGGARLAWVDVLEQRQARVSQARAEESADIGGADLARAITELQQTLTALEASQASFSRLSRLSLFDAI